MKAKSKVECRSRTGQSYSRAKHTWTPEFTDVPEELLKDDARMKVLVEDPHLEIKVDGRYISGPRAPKPGDPKTPDEAPSGRVASLERELESLDRRLSVAERAAMDARAETEAAKRVAADLQAQLDALKARAAETEQAAAGAKAGAEKATTEANAPPTKDEAGKKPPKG